VRCFPPIERVRESILQDIVNTVGLYTRECAILGSRRKRTASWSPSMDLEQRAWRGAQLDLGPPAECTVGRMAILRQLLADTSPRLAAPPGLLTSNRPPAPLFVEFYRTGEVRNW